MPVKKKLVTKKPAANKKAVVKKPSKKLVKKQSNLLAELVKEEKTNHFLYTLFVLFLLTFGVYVYYFFLK